MQRKFRAMEQFGPGAGMTDERGPATFACLWSGKESFPFSGEDENERWRRERRLPIHQPPSTHNIVPRVETRGFVRVANSRRASSSWQRIRGVTCFFVSALTLILSSLPSLALPITVIHQTLICRVGRAEGREEGGREMS